MEEGKEKNTKSQHVESEKGIFCIGCGNKNASISITEKDSLALCGKCREAIRICRDCGLRILDCELVDNEPVCKKCLEEYLKCDDCGNWISNDDAHSGNDFVVCQRCYENSYFYCDACGGLYHNDDYGGDSRCVNCYEDNGFYLAEDDIKVNQETRKKLKEALKKPLPIAALKLCTGNLEDYRIKELIEAVGEVLYPVYLFGLKDEHGYEISLPYVLCQKLKKSRWGKAFKTFNNSSMNHVGISFKLRKEQFNRIIRLIRFLTRR